MWGTATDTPRLHYDAVAPWQRQLWVLAAGSAGAVGISHWISLRVAGPEFKNGTTAGQARTTRQTQRADYELVQWCTKAEFLLASAALKYPVCDAECNRGHLDAAAVAHMVGVLKGLVDTRADVALVASVLVAVRPVVDEVLKGGDDSEEVVTTVARAERYCAGSALPGECNSRATPQAKHASTRAVVTSSWVAMPTISGWWKVGHAVRFLASHLPPSGRHDLTIWGLAVLLKDNVVSPLLAVLSTLAEGSTASGTLTATAASATFVTVSTLSSVLCGLQGSIGHRLSSSLVAQLKASVILKGTLASLANLPSKKINAGLDGTMYASNLVIELFSSSTRLATTIMALARLAVGGAAGLATVLVVVAGRLVGSVRRRLQYTIDVPVLNDEVMDDEDDCCSEGSDSTLDSNVSWEEEGAASETQSDVDASTDSSHSMPVRAVAGPVQPWQRLPRSTNMGVQLLACVAAERGEEAHGAGLASVCLLACTTLRVVHVGVVDALPQLALQYARRTHDSRQACAMRWSRAVAATARLQASRSMRGRPFLLEPQWQCTTPLSTILDHFMMYRLFGMEVGAVRRALRQNELRMQHKRGPLWLYAVRQFHSSVFDYTGPLSHASSLLQSLVMSAVRTRFGLSVDDVARHTHYAATVADLVENRRIVQQQTLDTGTKAITAVEGATSVPPHVPMEQRMFVPTKGSIVFDRVSFAFPSRPDVFVLKDVSLCVRPGERLAIVGESGSGKSTMLLLMLAVHLPVSGTVSIDGVSTRELNGRAWRRLVGYVSNDLGWEVSVWDQLKLGDARATRQEMVEALKAASAESFVADKDMMAKVTGFSGGQQQRIVLARALLRRNRLATLLDEATSALDTETEERVMRDVCAHRSTLVMACHRLSTLKHSEAIIVLRDGCIVERGTFGDLMGCHAGVLSAMVHQWNSGVAHQLQRDSSSISSVDGKSTNSTERRVTELLMQLEKKMDDLGRRDPDDPVRIRIDALRRHMGVTPSEGKKYFVAGDTT